MQRNKLSILALAVALTLFLLINILGAATLKSTRVDLTEDKLFTLSEGTLNILGDLDQDISLYYFFSKKVSDDIDPAISEYAERIQEVLEEYVAHSGGKLSLEVLDPEPFSDEEERAADFGLRAAPVQGGNIFIGLAATNEVDDEEIIPFLHPSREAYLEYDLTKMISGLDSATKPKVGLMSTLEMRGVFNPQTQRPPQPWFIVETIEGTFQLENIPPTATEIPEDITVLMLVHPKELSAETKFGIDQFVLRGGKLLCFVDPFCQRDMPPPDPQNPMASMQANATSDLDELFTAWGLELVDEKIVADRGSAADIPLQTGGTIPALVYLQLLKDRFESEDPIAAELDNVLMLTPGALKKLDGATTTVSPLIQTTEDSGTVDRMTAAMGLDPQALLERFVPEGKKQMLAARINGSAKTAYPDGPVPGGQPNEAWLKESKGPINVIVVADADMLVDGAWVRIQNFLGTRLADPQADNGNFVVNALDNLAGSNDLIGLRSRGRSRRPFDKVAEIRKRAEDRVRRREKDLQEELSSAQKRLNELQSERPDGQSEILTQEQREAIDQFRGEETRVRKDLRAVQLQKNQEIERLGEWLYAANALGIPLLIGLFGLFTLATGKKQRRS